MRNLKDTILNSLPKGIRALEKSMLQERSGKQKTLHDIGKTSRFIQIPESEKHNYQPRELLNVTRFFRLYASVR